MTTGLMLEQAADSQLGAQRRRRRRQAVVAAIAVMLVVTVGVLVAVDPFGSGSQARNRTRTSLATVKQQDLSSQAAVNGTLGYAGSYTVLSQAQGTITALPAVGQTITQGQKLFEADGKPVILLYGATPAYRNLAVGDKGRDVAQLNANLVALGYATSDQLDPSSDTFSAATATALKKLQAELGLDKTGTLEQAQAVFLPSAIRVTAFSASVGGAASGPILTASSTTRIVTVNLSANQQSQVKVGDHVTITLPDHKNTPGVVFSVGSVATAASAGATPTVPVVVIPSDPNATGSLDQAPVQVSIITATARNAFVVPVNALLALSGGGYAIETGGARGVHRLIPVQLGLFDDAAGVVQVSGKGLHVGQRVVVPAT